MLIYEGESYHMSVIEELEKADADEVKKHFIELVSSYLQPSYGSMSKRDFEILLFMKLQELQAITEDTDLYQLIKDLKISRTRVRNLLYEAKMRTSEDADLDRELIKLLEKPVFLKDGDKVAIEIENPLLTDHFRFKLKELKYITDGSFSAELVKLTYSAYIELVVSLTSEEVKQETERLLVESSIMPDKSFKGIFTEFVKKIGAKFANEAGEQVAKEALNYVPLMISGISGKCDEFINIVQELFKKDEE